MTISATPSLRPLKRPEGRAPGAVSGCARTPCPKPAPPEAAASLSGPPAKSPVLFIGLDVHNNSLAVSLAPSDTTEVRRYGIIGGEHEDVLQLAKKLAAGYCVSGHVRATRSLGSGPSCRI